MKISPIVNNSCNVIKNNKNINTQKKHQQNVSFKNIYVEDITDIGNYREGGSPARFTKKDALLFNELASVYPNQDCFICKGNQFLPSLKFREKPIGVPIFHESKTGTYKLSIDPNAPEYETVEMLLYKEEGKEAYKIPNLNFILGVTSERLTNPSLHYTIKMGMECHKKIMEKKYQLLEVIGNNDEVSLGDDSLITKAHNAIEDYEVAVLRHLIETAYLVLTDKASIRKVYESNNLQIRPILESKRKFDLVTASEMQPTMGRDTEGEDFCKKLTELYPNTTENIVRIKELTDYMFEKNIKLY